VHEVTLKVKGDILFDFKVQESREVRSVAKTQMASDSIARPPGTKIPLNNWVTLRAGPVEAQAILAFLMFLFLFLYYQ
jgi:hypothetical protein